MFPEPAGKSWVPWMQSSWDYRTCVALVTRAALDEMVFPGLLCVGAPVAVVDSGSRLSGPLSPEATPGGKSGLAIPPRAIEDQANSPSKSGSAGASPRKVRVSARY